MEEDEVGIFIASADVSASCAFKFDEQEKFVAGINKADEIFKKRFKRLQRDINMISKSKSFHNFYFVKL